MPSTKIKLKSTNSEAGSDAGAAKREIESFDLTEKVEYEDFTRENIPEEIIFPEELNRFLRDRIRELGSENGCLRRYVNELEEKLSTQLGRISHAKTDENFNQLQATSSSGVLKSSETTAAAKIVELSKKCREQTSEIEVLKSRCKKLESRSGDVNKREEIIKSCKDSGDGIDDCRPYRIEDELKSREEEIKILREKIHQINSKLYESKNSSTSLRQELNKAQKLLCKEVGESVTISGLASREQLGGWRGRAEQIKHLQNKLTEYEVSGRGSSSAAALSEKKRNVANLMKIDKERREKWENLSQELDRTRADFESCKRKRDAAKARVKVLENDLTSAKQSIAILNEKRSHDEQLIEALNVRLQSVEEKCRDRDREITVVKERAENECMKLCSEVNRLQSGNENLRRTVEERETEIDSLRRSSASRGGETKGKVSPSSRSGKKIEFRSNGDYNEYVTLGIAAEAERERLLELVTVLNRRLEEERFATDKIAETLRGERSKLARLETKLQRLEMERVGMSRINGGYKPRSSKSDTVFSVSSRLAGDGGQEDTRFRLELLEEECLALKTRLATVQRDKASDLAMYKQMLDQARKTFQDAYRGKPNSSSYSTVTI